MHHVECKTVSQTIQLLTLSETVTTVLCLIQLTAVSCSITIDSGMLGSFSLTRQEEPSTSPANMHYAILLLKK